MHQKQLPLRGPRQGNCFHSPYTSGLLAKAKNGDIQFRREANSTSVSQIPLQVNSAPIYVDSILNTFILAYLHSSLILSPIRQSNSTEPPASWLQIAVALPRRGHLLSIALQALCMNKIRRVYGNNAFLMQGMTVHGQALRALQNEIHSTNTAAAVETLTAIRVLGMYEMFEGTMGSAIGWTTHEERVEEWMQLRGFSSSQHDNDPRPKFRKVTLFGEERWCVEPWDDKPKDCIQQLNDIGLLLPVILENLHTIQNLTEGQIRQRCQHLQDHFNAWHAHLLSLSPTPPYWDQLAELTTPVIDIPPVPFVTAFNFLNIRVAEGLAIFWAIRLSP
ncbi:hypothetical protein PISL3812_06081 [Talaromyces islandicus]|uniref:Transcription factor domain-containing protein n=1 Tax=Talaromyces islandicus TaxID=28573 RepID=A0A0U1M1R5_TALIS|nr:hypothetical protein PISL3812_06081 [Talaromyces islandicus]